MRRIAASFFALLAAALAPGLAPALAQDPAPERHAVVAGAESYPNAVGAAAGAAADARHVAEALEAEGFEVTLLEDPGEAALKRSLFALADRLAAAPPDSVGLFYFAGQSVQINGDTFLLPVDARTTDDLTLSGSALAADQVADRLDMRQDITTLIVIDAASPNNLTSRFALRTGVATFDRPENGIVIFSNYPDQVALPRQPGVSVFARAFANLVHNQTPSFDDAIDQMRAEVSDGSAGSRYAWVSGRLNPLFTLSARDMLQTRSMAIVSDDAPRSLAAPEPTPMPAPAAPSRGLSSGAGAGASAGASAPAEAEAPAEQIHYVEVFFGTDREVEQSRDGSYEFISTTARALTYGIAEVSIPPKHVAGELESPRWWRLEFSPNPERHVVYNGATLLEEDAFFEDVRATVQASELRQAFVFIHGFNTTFEDAARRTAQMHHDLAFDGAPIFYSWPSRGQSNPLAYAHDGNAADRTAPKLQEFLMEVADRTGAEQIHLIAHSMGNRALIEALDEIAEDMALEGREAPFNQIVLSAPDIDRDVFQAIADEIIPTAERVTLYASANDQALRVSRQFNGNPRAGDASDGIVIVDGLNTIDASEVKTELFDIGHDYFATDDSILTDIRALIATNADPGERGLLERRLPPQQYEYWAILRGMLGR